jgi:hypothetical protein
VEESGSYLHMSISYKEKSLLERDLHNMQHKRRLFFNEIKAQKSTMSNPETLNLCQIVCWIQTSYQHTTVNIFLNSTK